MTDEPGNTVGRNTAHTLTGPSDFPTTRWTLVIAAADPQRKEARSALVSLCEGYWYPLYAYIRRRGYPADQAQDLTQQFFIRVLEGRYLDRADPDKGRFRSFMLNGFIDRQDFIPPGPDPRLEQVVQLVAGLTEQVGRLANQVEALEKKIR